jgi:hypothetical protein
MGFGGSGGGTSSISGASDVALNNPSDDQTLGYDSGTAKWQNVTAANPLAGISGAKMLVTQDFTNASTVRSTSRTDVTVRWRGPVEPTNMINGDEWYVTTP